MSAAVQLNPDELAVRVESLIERRQFGAVTRLIPAIATLAAGRSLAARLTARLAFAEGRSAGAAALLDNALVTWPADVALLRLRAEIALAAGDPVRAAIASADAVIADRGNAEAKSLLGRSLLKLGRNDEAYLCLREAVTENPHDVPGILALADASPDQAALLLSAAAARMPYSAPLHNRLLQILIDRDEPEAAADAAERARDAGALDLAGVLLAGHAAAMREDWETARSRWREVLRQAPQHPSAPYRLAAEQARRPDRLDPALLAAADDARARSAELAALAGGTILPERVRIAFSSAGISGPVLDLGCGTGLCAIAAGNLPISAWDGVEASHRLAAIARDRRLYRDLSEADPIEFLLGDKRRWHGISFNFTGGMVANLADLFLALASHLLPGGLAIGAIVAAPESNRFGPFCCFEHNETHFRAAVAEAGLSAEPGEIEPLMTVDGLVLRGRIVVLKAP